MLANRVKHSLTFFPQKPSRCVHFPTRGGVAELPSIPTSCFLMLIHIPRASVCNLMPLSRISLEAVGARSEQVGEQVGLIRKPT